MIEYCRHQSLVGAHPGAGWTGRSSWTFENTPFTHPTNRLNYINLIIKAPKDIGRFERLTSTAEAMDSLLQSSTLSQQRRQSHDAAWNVSSHLSTCHPTGLLSTTTITTLLLCFLFPSPFPARRSSGLNSIQGPVLAASLE